MSGTNARLLANVMAEYRKIGRNSTIGEYWKYVTEDDLWSELCLCVLSSNVPFESASSAFQHLKRKGLLTKEYLLSNSEAIRTLSKELSKPLYLPIRKNGDLRKYRFPQIRATYIVKAARTIYKSGYSLKALLQESKSEYDARDVLTKRVPGVGLKQASLFLRNIGYSRSLAIIDTHIISFLEKFERPCESRITQPHSKEEYENIEKMMQTFARKLNAELSLLDFAIWSVMKSSNWRNK